MIELKGKAKTILERSNTERLKRKYLVVPGSDLAQALGAALNRAGYTVVTGGGKRIREMLNPTPRKSNQDSLVYQIPCSGCDSSYYGETCRGFDTRVKEHKADLRHHRPSSALVDHVDKAGHLPKWKEAKILQSGLDRKRRKVLEALYISTNKNINKRTGDIVWATTAALMCIPRDRGR